VITSESGIQEMLNHIDDIPENEFEELRDRAQRYVIAYHNPVSKDALSPFFVN
jgi:hypothetical protein